MGEQKAGKRMDRRQERWGIDGRKEEGKEAVKKEYIRLERGRKARRNRERIEGRKEGGI